MNGSKSKIVLTALLSFSLFPLASCTSHNKGRIIFNLNGGEFPGQDFSASYLEGDAGTRVEIEIPDPVKKGYYFVGWRELSNDGKYREINLRYDDEGEGYYVYPYGQDTFYAYFEPLATISFDLGEEAIKKGAELVAPKRENSGFDEKTSLLNGYLKKPILSTEYLPTAILENATFDYWYTEYPLVSTSKIVDGAEIYYFVLDTSTEKGIYPFNTGFGSSSMEFPQAENEETFTLYAHWTSDPLATIEYNLPDVPLASFYFTDNFAERLLHEASLVIDPDFAVVGKDSYYYRKNGCDKRFAGFFLDKEFKFPYYLTSPNPITDISIYYKWQERFDIRIDLDNGAPLVVCTDCLYEGDSANMDDRVESAIDLAVREDAIFRCYQLTATSEDLDLTRPIEREDLTFENGKYYLDLKASYTDKLEYQFVYDFPSGATESLPTKKYYFEEGQKIERSLEEVVAELENVENPQMYSFKGMYTLNVGRKETFDSKIATGGDKTIYLEIDFVGSLIVEDILTLGLESVNRYETYVPEKLVDEDMICQNTPSSHQKGTATYLFDGYYGDASLTEEIFLPISIEHSHTDRNIRHIYRKFAKSALLTFKKVGSEDQTMLVLEGRALSDYKEKIEELLGVSIAHLYLDQEGKIPFISLSGEDQTIYVL